MLVQLFKHQYLNNEKEFPMISASNKGIWGNDNRSTAVFPLQKQISLPSAVKVGSCEAVYRAWVSMPVCIGRVACLGSAYAD